MQFLGTHGAPWLQVVLMTPGRSGQSSLSAALEAFMSKCPVYITQQVGLKQEVTSLSMVSRDRTKSGWQGVVMKTLCSPMRAHYSKQHNVQINKLVKHRHGGQCSHFTEWDNVKYSQCWDNEMCMINNVSSTASISPRYFVKKAR